MGCRILAIWLAIILSLAGCSSSGPFRSATPDSTSDSVEQTCRELYLTTDGAIRDISTNFSASYDDRKSFLAHMQSQIEKTPRSLQKCWETAHEKHVSYDLYYAEFDDTGQATDIARGAKYGDSELHLIETSILQALSDKNGSGLNLVVFTHGWHGNALADNSYSIEFKAVLQDIQAREESYRASLEAAIAAKRQPHRVIGIEVAWRGDSFLSPAIPFVEGSKNAANVWDRKIAAETIATGAVQELFAFLNQVYLDNSCQGTAVSSKAQGPCGRVHLIAIGHSFGALIDFRSLTARLESGLNVDACTRAYGFGDMTILLNPAFEGARYRALFNNGSNRPALVGAPYFGDQILQSQCPPTASAPVSDDIQIPTIVTLQSLGDSATGTWFRRFRRLTTPFEKTLSAQEALEKDAALGWVPDFRTHSLTLTSGNADQCLNMAATSYCPFRQEKTVQADPEVGHAGTHLQRLQLSWAPGVATEKLPAFIPLWSVAVDTQIMKDHDDFWNPQIVRLISVLFEDAYEQSEWIHGGGAPL
jgi:hypothetical protein